MTKEEFIKAWDNHELDYDWSSFVSENYPDRVTFEDFEEYMVTECVKENKKR